MHIELSDFEVQDLWDDCMKQSSLYYYYSDMQTQCEDEYAKLERQLAQEEAETELRLREEMKGTKATEGYYKARIAADPALNTLRDQLIAKATDIATLKNAVRALDKKGGQLDNLTRLHLGKLYNNESTYQATANQVRLQLNSKRQGG